MLNCPRCSQPLSQKFSFDLLGEEMDNKYECGQCGCEVEFNSPQYCLPGIVPPDVLFQSKPSPAMPETFEGGT